jgi:uncharacterized membrane protein YdjX (TVP38/TMEM64 family)
MYLLVMLRELLLVHRRAIVGICILITVGVLLLLFSGELERFYRGLFQLQERNAPIFYLTFAALLVLAFLTSLFPASLFGVLGGMLFGTILGFAICTASLLVAALIAFLFARYFFRTVSRRIAAHFLDLDRLEARLAKQGWRYALLIRAAPTAPFAITSYGLGLTPIMLGEYLATTMAALPFLFVCVYFGSIGRFLIGAGGGIDRTALWELALGFSAAIVLLSVVSYLLSKLMLRSFGHQARGNSNQRPG